ncbi:sugar ABC transporter permease [Paenibacillus swuensis]|uniref:Sugar ABC transporter permease n=1 Tax=Paenibacillus swuensis TaxID=1178515 RepID=A0A172TFH9_9BACL|nr:carbohydrate ABC transporter permease [Paenibacillus swuensis]ANE45809.1 sugar ABC transporter permease [Paenibacillus swuensis]
MGSLLVHRDWGKIAFSIFMFMLGIAMIVPFIFMISASFKPSAYVFSEPLQLIPQPVYWGNYDRLFQHPYYFKWYWNSIVTVVILVVFRFVLVTAAAYAFAKLKFPGRNALMLVLVATMMIPPDTTIVARYLLYKYLHLIDTSWVIILPAAFDVFFIFLLRQFFMAIPDDLSEAAIIDGCGHYRIYTHIILPLAKPALLTMVLFTYIWNWNDFVNPFIFINDMDKQLVTVGLEYFQQQAGQDYAMQMAGSCLIILLPVILFAVMQKYFVQGIAMTGIKG